MCNDCAKHSPDPGLSLPTRPRKRQWWFNTLLVADLITIRIAHKRDDGRTRIHRPRFAQDFTAAFADFLDGEVVEAAAQAMAGHAIRISSASA